MIASPQGNLTQHTAQGNDAFGAMAADLNDKGFLIAKVDDVVNWARTGSLWWMT